MEAKKLPDLHTEYAVLSDRDTDRDRKAYILLAKCSTTTMDTAVRYPWK